MEILMGLFPESIRTSASGQHTEWAVMRRWDTQILIQLRICHPTVESITRKPLSAVQYVKVFLSCSAS